MPGHGRITFTKSMKIAPHDSKTHDLCLTRAGCQFEGVFYPAVVFRIDTESGSFTIGTAELVDGTGQASDPPDFIKVNYCFDCFPLAVIISKRNILACRCSDHMITFEPVVKEFPRCVGSAGIIVFAPCLHKGPKVVGDRDRRCPAAFYNFRGFSFFRSDSMAIGFFVGCIKWFKGGRIDNSVCHEIFPFLIYTLNSLLRETKFYISPASFRNRLTKSSDSHNPAVRKLSSAPATDFISPLLLAITSIPPVPNV